MKLYFYWKDTDNLEELQEIYSNGSAEQTEMPS
jgi:hypothetical protein